MPDQDPDITRRKFIKTTAAAGTAFMIVPRHVLGRGFQAPSDLLNIATVGATGMGAVNTRAVMSQNIVALCDVDFGLLDARLEAWSKPPKPPGPPRPQGPPPPPTPWRNHGPSKAQIAADARCPAPDEEATLRRFVEQQVPRLQKYRDYREMLEKQKDLDAIIVATPDHMHAVIASNAMSLGKHVYVQKPLCWSVHEARHLAKKAQDNPKIVTQMGNQRHSADNSRRGIEYVQSGVLGEVREVHVWTNRPLGFWPQGIPRPARLTTDPAQLRWDNRGVMQRLSAAMAGTNGAYPVPDKLSWDLFLGVAPAVEYHPLYHPFNWRGWVDWGQGALGDMGAHLMDFPVWSLNLGLPTIVETESTPFNGASFPSATTTYFQFPARKGMPPVKLTWYDGGLLPPDPEELENETLDPNGGVLYVGKKAKLLHYSEGARLLPTAKHNSFGPPKERLPRVPHGDHEMNWVNAIKGTEQISVPFDYAAKLTEIMLLGIVSLRANSKLHYDAANMRVTNNVAANDFLTREYRAGFSL